MTKLMFYKRKWGYAIYSAETTDTEGFMIPRKIGELQYDDTLKKYAYRQRIFVITGSETLKEITEFLERLEENNAKNKTIN